MSGRNITNCAMGEIHQPQLSGGYATLLESCGCRIPALTRALCSFT